MKYILKWTHLYFALIFPPPSVGLFPQASSWEKRWLLLIEKQNLFNGGELI